MEYNRKENTMKYDNNLYKTVSTMKYTNKSIQLFKKRKNTSYNLFIMSAPLSLIPAFSITLILKHLRLISPDCVSLAMIYIKFLTQVKPREEKNSKSFHA